MNPQQTDVLILGAGAAGMMCAIEAGRRGRKVALLDHADRPGKKILISGGGRCNFTNLHTRPENFISANPHFAKSALARYTPADFVALVEQHGIPFHEKTLGQLFCDHSAQQIVSMLVQECAAANVHTTLNASILAINPVDGPHRFRIESSRGIWLCSALIIATGGPSIPKMGSTGFGYEVARQFGVSVIDPRPALVPFVLSDEDQRRWCDLSGLSTEVIATTGTNKRQISFREKMLITHRGLSGPVILQLSSYWTPHTAVSIDLAPGANPTSVLRFDTAVRTPATALAALRQCLPARFAERWLDHNLPPNWTNLSLNRLDDRLHCWQLTPRDTEGYAKAEVTAGGVDTAELDAKTMQSKSVPGLYFIGEVVDVTGWLGGYNFHWAWASGAAAGRSV